MTISLKSLLIPAITMILAWALTRLEVFGFSLKIIVYATAWIAIGLVIFRVNKNLRGKGPGIRRSFLGITFAIYLIASVVSGLEFFICREIQKGSCYVSVHDEHLQLQCRTYECFQTTAGCKFTKLRTLVENVQWTTLLERNEVDLSEWTLRPTIE